MTVRGQLIALLLGVACAFALFTSTYFPAQQRASAVEGLTSQLISVQRLAADLLGPAIAFEDRQGIRNTVASILRLDSAAFAVVTNTNGETLAADAVPSYADELQQFLQGADSFHSERVMFATTPIEGLGVTIGYLTVAFHTATVRATIAESRRASLLASILILALGLLGGTFVALRLIRPLPAITNAFVALSNGQFEHQVPETGAREFVRLSRAFNRTRETLRALFSEMSRANEALAAEIAIRRSAEAAITDSLREKEVLLKEIHHRVKNNLQIISSLLHLQAQRITDPKVREIFTDSQNRVRSMALIHEKLYQSKGLASIHFSEYINNLVAHLMRTYGVDASRITIMTDLADATLNLDTAIPCGLIVSELVSNALKHAFPQCSSGTVRIELTHEAGGLELSVSDNGIGLPPGLTPETCPSLGLQLVTALVRQLGGILEVSSEQGTRFSVKFEPVKYRERV